MRELSWISIPFSSLEELKDIPEVKTKIQKSGFHQLSVEHVYAMCSGAMNYTYWNLIVEFDNNDWWEPIGGAIFEATLNELNALGISDHDDWVHEFAHKMHPPLVLLPSNYQKEWEPRPTKI